MSAFSPSVEQSKQKIQNNEPVRDPTLWNICPRNFIEDFTDPKGATLTSVEGQLDIFDQLAEAWYPVQTLWLETWDRQGELKVATVIWFISDITDKLSTCSTL